MQAQEVLERFLTYGPTTFADYDVSELDEMGVWLRRHPGAWRIDRRIPGPLKKTQRTFLLVGEEGSGKSTALMELEEQLELSENSLVVRLDFSHSDALYLEEDGDFAKEFDKILLSQAEAIAYSKGIWRQYQASFARRVCLKGTGEVVNQIRLAISEAKLRDMPDDEVLSNSQIEKAARIHRNSFTSLGAFALHSLQHVRDMQVVFLVDNVDHLPQKYIPRVLYSLSTIISGDTHAYVGIRPENEPFYPNFRQLRATQRRELSSDSFMYDVAEVRLHGAISWASEHAPALLPEVRATAEIVRSNLAAVRRDKLSVNLIEQWQNGNLRQMMLFMLELSDQILATTGPPGPLRGAVYDKIIRFSTPKYLRDVFTSRGITDTHFGPLPFSFPQLRILAFLAAHHNPDTGAVPLDELKRCFVERFGIKERRLMEILHEMEGRLGNSGAPLRILLGGGQDLLSPTSVVLLPAGRIFIQQVVFSADFLSWIYETTTRPLPPVEQRGIRQTKFDKATIVLRERLIKEFLREHPYMKENRGIRESERGRLDAYVEEFNYGPGRWFLTQMSDELRQYAKQRQLILAEFQPVARKIREMTKRLDDCYQGVA